MVRPCQSALDWSRTNLRHAHKACRQVMSRPRQLTTSTFSRTWTGRCLQAATPLFDSGLGTPALVASRVTPSQVDKEGFRIKSQGLAHQVDSLCPLSLAASQALPPGNVPTESELESLRLANTMCPGTVAARLVTGRMPTDTEGVTTQARDRRCSR